MQHNRIDKIKQKLRSKSFSVIWVLILVLTFGLAGAIGWKMYTSLHNKKSSSTASTSNQIQTRAVAATQVAQTWSRLPGVVMPGITSTDTHVISPGHYRMYYLNGPSGLVYADSTDGRVWGSPQSLGVMPDPGKLISNPSILQLSNGNWIMLYEQAPMTQPGENGQPAFGPSNQHNLYLAISSDGKTFMPAGLAIDSSRADGYFASVPNMILLPNGNIRVYYVSGGQNIASAVSSDGGRTWIRDGGYRLAGGDPDVFYKNGKWIMYYTDLNPSENSLREAISTDGLNWTSLEGQVVKKTGSNYAIVDPDVFQVSTDKYVMNFNESLLSQNGQQPSPNQGGLQQAVYNGDIFSN